MWWEDERTLEKIAAFMEASKCRHKQTTSTLVSAFGELRHHYLFLRPLACHRIPSPGPSMSRQDGHYFRSGAPHPLQLCGVRFATHKHRLPASSSSFTSWHYPCGPTSTSHRHLRSQSRFYPPSQRALEEFQKYSLQEQSKWLSDISHDICDPALKRGSLFVWDGSRRDVQLSTPNHSPPQSISPSFRLDSWLGCQSTVPARANLRRRQQGTQAQWPTVSRVVTKTSAGDEAHIPVNKQPYMSEAHGGQSRVPHL
jgi:hypothetical protein